MPDTQIQEGCKLIAEFMGMKHIKTLFDSHGYEQYNYTMPDELSKQVYGYVGAECFLEDQFSKSWDWLMPVFSKINDMVKSEEIEHDYQSSAIHDCIEISILQVNIIAAQNFISQFIQWYNQNNQQ